MPSLTFFCISLIFFLLSFSFWLIAGGAVIDPIIDPSRSIVKSKSKLSKSQHFLQFQVLQSKFGSVFETEDLRMRSADHQVLRYRSRTSLRSLGAALARFMSSEGRRAVSRNLDNSKYAQYSVIYRLSCKVLQQVF